MNDGLLNNHAAVASTPPKSELQEMAYLLLEDVRVEVTAAEGVEAQSQQKLPLRQWINVSQCSSSAMVERPDRQNQCHQESVDTAAQLPPLDGTCCCCCRRCNLVLLQRQRATTMEEAASWKSALELQLDWEQVPPFHGTMADLFSVIKGLPSAASACSCPGSAKAKRSDAALVAGLLVACREQVTVVHCRVLFREEKQVALLFTLAFPHLQLPTSAANTVTTQPSILAQPQPSASPKSNTRSRQASKPLHPALQLLLSLVRSDWGQLEVLEQRLLHRAVFDDARPSRKKKPALFPSKLALGEIYDCIQGSSSTSYRVSHSNGELTRNKKLMESDACTLTSLPLDVLVEKMAPFLHAQTLAALRTTCTYLNWSLRGVIPGLKLRLYSHQVSSLSWMRRRESSLIRTETDCFQIRDALPDGDVHRAITGGATVRLASKPNENVGCIIRLDSYTGREIAPEQQLGNNGPLSRRVARGGLLCDDPGLGKTVTVLALILQTCGLSTASDMTSSALSTRHNAAREATPSPFVSTEWSIRSENDAIFQAYWAEQVVAEFRRPAFLKLVNELGKKIRRGDSVPLGVIKKAIANDEYGADFSAFEAAVE
jgi:hypothetical protein